MQISGRKAVGAIVLTSMLIGAPAASLAFKSPDRFRDGKLSVVGLTQDGRLISFRESRPRDARTIGTVSGLNGDTRLVGIDYRPASGKDGSRGVLFGLGDQGGIYTVDDKTAAATKSKQLTGATLSGASFGVDFNPVVDRLRVISDTGQNLRINVDTGEAIPDTGLTYPPAPPATAPTTGTGVGAAYTNNDADPNTGTTLFDIDSALDQIAIQSPANSGLLAATGKLGVDTSTNVGMDIHTVIRDGSPFVERALAALTVDGVSTLYDADLLQGRVIARGAFLATNQVTGIAIPLNQL